MRLTIPLYSGTLLANVRYRWIVSGVEQSEQSSGITQPDANFPLFEFNVTPPSGADEIIAYDATNLANWNVGQYQIAVINANIAAFSTGGGVTAVGASIRAPSTTFRKVYEAVCRRMGYNPKGDQIKEDVAQNILEHINDRLRLAWSLWDWPQLKVVEWRAFRTVWTTSSVFKNGDELYYFGDGVVPTPRTVDPPDVGDNNGYYTCIADAPAGTLPTNATYFSPLDLTDRFIAYQQTSENPIGDLLDVYLTNPRERARRRTKIFVSYPSSKGIDVRCSQDVVWIRYGVPCPQFTLRPFIVGNMAIGTPFYDPQSGNCFSYTGELLGPSGTTHGGTLISFPLFLAGYVKPAAYADCILETASEAKTRVALAQQAMIEADEYLIREVDALAAQGQRLYYPAFPQRRYHYGRRIEIAAGAIPTEQFAGNP